MKWIIYSMIAISYILIVLGIMFSSDTLGSKFAFSGSVTLVYGFILGLLNSIFGSK